MVRSLSRESAIDELEGLVRFLRDHPELPVSTHVVAIVSAEGLDTVAEVLRHYGCDEDRTTFRRMVTLEEMVTRGEDVDLYPLWPMHWQTLPPGGFLTPAVISGLDASRELDNCPPAPPQDGMGLFWDHCGNFSVTSQVEPDGSGRADKALHTCSRFGDYTGVSVLIAVSKDGRWQWRCFGCPGTAPRFGLCPPCAERELQQGDPPF
ncbi:hypothetical protein ACQPYK_49545 (plasmid) [Streptosporangium sp. CA-135522]|uniref:hypothetical protein n=1 Tax=Streptosporangium sp. CA-135522 TaxID=3240072 RepID=UPI003D8E521D